jgi:hypothetical protein
MKVKAYVNDEIDSSYGEGKRKVDQRSLILSDHDDERRLMQMMEMPMSPEQRATYSGKLQGKVINVHVLEFGQNMFGGRVRIQKGEIVYQTAATKAA